MLSLIVLLLLLLWSVWVVLQHVLPKQMSALRLILAWHSAAQWPRLAAWLQPKAPKGCAGGCNCPVAKTNTNSNNNKNGSDKRIQTNNKNNHKNSHKNSHKSTAATLPHTTAATQSSHTTTTASHAEQPVRWRNSV